MVAGKRELTRADIADHTQCEFGKWYYSQGRELFGQLPVFQLLGSQHEAVHVLAQEIAGQYGNGERRQAAESLAGFSALTQQLFTSLDELERAAAQQ
jgi:methyl-accepting chemotaxis protein